MNNVRLGIIGYGSMGSVHAKCFLNKTVPNAKLSAICDISDAKLQQAKTLFGDSVQYYARASEMIRGGEVDAVLVATPHYDHPTLAIEALQAGLHVLIEKPAGVYTKHVREMNTVAAGSDKVFGIMLNQRMRPLHQKVRDFIRSGELGDLKRIQWTITDWYRSQAYYDNGGWRATWAGEGGGVLLNQCPHNLDLWQWFFGLPSRIRASCYFGKYHNIEVEDDVTACMEYENGVTGVLIASTGEAPGTNRLEIVGNRGKMVMENQQLTFWRNRVDERTWNSTVKEAGMGKPECWKCEIPVGGPGEEHLGILKNFVSAIVNDTPLMAPGVEGIHSLQLSNAMLLSSWTDGWAELPVDEDLFLEHFQKRVKTSRHKKDVVEKIVDVSGTF